MSPRATLRDVELPLARPLTTARGTVDTRRGLLVRVDADGLDGVGEATPLPGWTESLERCRSALRTAADALAARGRDEALAAVDGAPAARHGLSLALADLDARRAGRPLYRHLGGDRRIEAVPVNATVGDAPAAATAARAAASVAAGFDCLKVKVGAGPVERDVERLTAVREVVGPRVEIRADANGAWSPDAARTALDAAADLDVTYVEQPLAADDLSGHAELRGGPVGIALDETLARVSASAALDAGAADVLVCKPMVLGGIDRARDVARSAIDAGIDAVVTTTIDGVVARTAAVHLAASLADPPACGLATADRLAEDLAPDPAPVEAGAVRVPQGDGNGPAVERGR